MVQTVTNFVTAHWVEIGVALYAAEKLLKAVTALTPNKTDDKIAAKVEELMQKYLPKSVA